MRLNTANQCAQWLESQTIKVRALGFAVQELDLRHFFGRTDRLVDTLAQFDSLNASSCPETQIGFVRAVPPFTPFVF